MLDPKTITNKELIDEIDFLSHLEEGVVEMLKELTPIEKDIIILRFGLVYESLDAPKTGKLLNLEWNEVIKMENKILKKLRSHPNIDLLQKYLKEKIDK